MEFMLQGVVWEVCDVQAQIGSKGEWIVDCEGSVTNRSKVVV